MKCIYGNVCKGWIRKRGNVFRAMYSGLGKDGGLMKGGHIRRGRIREYGIYRRLIREE